MKTIIPFLLMLITISTSYSLEPYKIVKVHDSTVFKSRLSEDLKTLVVLGDNKVVNFYNTEDWTQTKSIKVYPRDKNYDITISGDTVYWLQYGYTIGSMNTTDTSKISWKTPKTLGEAPPRISEFFIFDNGDLMVPYRVDQYANPEYHYIYAVINDVPDVPMGIIYGYNYNRNLIVGHGGFSGIHYNQGNPPDYSGGYRLAILNTNSKVVWEIEDSFSNYINLAIKNDNTLIGFTNEMIYSIDAKGKVTSKPKSQLTSYFLEVENLNYILPMKDDRFLLFCYDKEIKLVQAETGNVIDNFINDKLIVNVSNLPVDYQFLLVDKDGNAKIFKGDSLLNGFSADFNADQTVIPVDSNVTFHPYNDLNAISYKWDFGDGETSTEKEPAHLYSKPGKYDVSLEISDGTRSIKNTKNEYIEVKGIKFFSQYSIDTAWTKKYADHIAGIDYTDLGDYIRTKSDNKIATLIHGSSGEIFKNRIVESEYLGNAISSDGNYILKYTIDSLCRASFDASNCLQKFQIGVIVDYHYEKTIESVISIPSKPLILVSGLYEYEIDKFKKYNKFYNYLTGAEEQISDTKLQIMFDKAPELINRHTGDLFYSDTQDIILIDANTKAHSSILKFSDFPNTYYNRKMFLNNANNDLIFFIRDRDYNGTIYRYFINEKRLDSLFTIPRKNYDRIVKIEFIENSDNVIILSDSGKLDILDYVKNEIVDHAEIPAEFIGLSLNPKGGEFATLSDDGKVIVWKTKNIPLDTPLKYVNEIYIIYPNPAGDYINIEFMLENNTYKTATIYSPLGNKLIETENQTTIDISMLYYGVYFVKVGNRYAKFVKM
jgi:PKD repeat protein